MVMIQNPTYFTTEGVDYGVLALTLWQLATVSAALDFALDRDPMVGAEALDIRNVALEAIQYLEGREANPDAIQP